MMRVQCNLGCKAIRCCCSHNGMLGRLSCASDELVFWLRDATFMVISTVGVVCKARFISVDLGIYDFDASLSVEVRQRVALYNRDLDVPYCSHRCMVTESSVAVNPELSLCSKNSKQQASQRAKPTTSARSAAVIQTKQRPPSSPRAPLPVGFMMKWVVIIHIRYCTTNFL